MIIELSVALAFTGAALLSLVGYTAHDRRRRRRRRNSSQQHSSSFRVYRNEHFVEDSARCESQCSSSSVHYCASCSSSLDSSPHSSPRQSDGECTTSDECDATTKHTVEHSHEYQSVQAQVRYCAELDCHYYGETSLYGKVVDREDIGARRDTKAVYELATSPLYGASDNESHDDEYALRERRRRHHQCMCRRVSKESSHQVLSHRLSSSEPPSPGTRRRSVTPRTVEALGSTLDTVYESSSTGQKRRAQKHLKSSALSQSTGFASARDAECWRPTTAKANVSSSSSSDMMLCDDDDELFD